MLSCGIFPVDMHDMHGLDPLLGAHLQTWTSVFLKEQLLKELLMNGCTVLSCITQTNYQVMTKCQRLLLCQPGHLASWSSLLIMGTEGTVERS